MMTQSYGWNLQRLQHSRNEMKLLLSQEKFFLCFCNVLAFHVDSMDDAGDTVAYTATIDHDISRMENLLDQWTADLKKNVMVLADFPTFIHKWLFLYLVIFLHTVIFTNLVGAVLHWK